MKKTILLFAVALCFNVQTVNAQTSCSELLDYVTSKSYGTTYSSYTSDAISKVTFYEVSVDYKTHYFAVVQFTSSYKNYIYQVSYNTQSNYSYDYLTSAGKAFWKYIAPYNSNLGCAPDFD